MIAAPARLSSNPTPCVRTFANSSVRDKVEGSVAVVTWLLMVGPLLLVGVIIGNAHP